MGSRASQVLLVALLAIGMLLVFMVNRLEDRLMGSNESQPVYRLYWPSKSSPVLEASAARWPGESAEQHFMRVYEMLMTGKKRMEEEVK